MIDQDSCHPPQKHMFRFLPVHTGERGGILKDILEVGLKLALQNRHSDFTGEGMSSVPGCRSSLLHCPGCYEGLWTSGTDSGGI